MSLHKEIAFESEICAHLAAHVLRNANNRSRERRTFVAGSIRPRP